MSKIKKFVLILSALLSLGYFGGLPALADTTIAKVGPCAKVKVEDPKVSCSECNPTDPSTQTPSLCACHPEYNYGSAYSKEQLASCEACNNSHQDSLTLSKNCLQNNRIVTDLNIFVDFLAGLATIVIIGTLIAGGIQYSMAGNPQAATNARKRITNGLLALVALFFIWAFLQWLIPGGV